MKNEQYNEYYDTQFMNEYIKYKVNKNDEINDKPHMYSIPPEKRKILHHLEVYTIEQENREYVDDALSITFNKKTNKLYLYIHISDPTEYINVKSKLWNQICQQGYTIYPSNNKPMHMMPETILLKANLRNIYNDKGHKNAITIKVNIDTNTYDVNMVDVEIMPTSIKIQNENAYTSKDFGQLLKKNKVFKIGNKIAEKLREKKGVFVGKKSEVNNAYPVYDKESKSVNLYLDSDEEVKIKQMMTEFKILTNNIVANYILTNLKEKHNIYRKIEDNQCKKEQNGNEVIEYLVSNSVRACYKTLNINQDLIEKKFYVHFTSPLRRAIDCVCHFIVKYIMIKKVNEKVVFPFKKKKIYDIMEHCDEINKKIKKLQYNDIKYRTVQAMDNMLFKKTTYNIYKQWVIAIKFKIRSYSGIFLNIQVIKIDEYPVYLTMTFKRQFLNDVKINNLIKNNVIINGTIRTILFQKSMMDAGKFPDLENFLWLYLE